MNQTRDEGGMFFSLFQENTSKKSWYTLGDNLGEEFGFIGGQGLRV